MEGRDWVDGLIGASRERDFSIDNVLVQVYSIIELIWWTGLAPWEFQFPFPGSRTPTFYAGRPSLLVLRLEVHSDSNLVSDKVFG